MAKKVIFDEKQVQKGAKQGVSAYPQSYPAGGQTGYEYKKVRNFLTRDERKQLEK